MNKEAEIKYFRTFVINKYVEDVMKHSDEPVKKCANCGAIKPISEFHTYKPKGIISLYCKECLTKTSKLNKKS